MNKKTKGIIFLIVFFVLLPLMTVSSLVQNLKDNFKIIYILTLNLIFISLLLGAYYYDFKNYAIDFKQKWKRHLKMGFKCWGWGLLVMMVANGLINSYGPNNIAQNEEAVRDMLTAFPLFVAFSAIIYAPLTEEIINRKILKDLINHKWGFIISSALLFSTLHVLPSFSSVWDILYIIPYGALGFALAYVYYQTNNLLIPIIIHTFHNSILIILYLIIF